MELVMSKWKLSVILFIILVNLSASVIGQDDTSPICMRNGNYNTNSTYGANLRSLLSSLSSDTGFYNASAGEGKDRVNALALCRGDRTLQQCRSCVQTASVGLLRQCPNQKQAIIWYEFCMLRYSNEPIYATQATDPGLWIRTDTAQVSNLDEFSAARIRLFDAVRARAASGGPELKVGVGITNVSASQTLHVLMECTPDLSEDECDNCLQKGAQESLNCCGEAGVRVLMPSCSLRYELDPFFNDTRLRELNVSLLSLPLPPVPSPPATGRNDHNNNTSSGKNDHGKVIILVVVIAGVTLLFIGCAVFFMRKRMKQGTVYILQATEEISSVESLQYDFGTIRDATNDFSDLNKLGEGGFGAVYHGNLPTGEDIAVKRLSMNSSQGIAEFKNEVLLMARLQHRNLVRLLGFSAEGTERLLIYECVQNASLDKFIFDPIKRSQLDWDKRNKIMGGIAKGLLYLHEDSRLKIIHRDLKASNILLDGGMNPKIADFGMARLCGQDETQVNTNKIVGTYGYMPPEYAMHGQFSTKSDVFSYGVLVLEIISGQRNTYIQSGENVQEDLLTLVWKNWQEGTPEKVIDRVLMNNDMSHILRCLHLGLLCVQENPTNRPAMASIIVMLSSSTITLPVPSEPAYYIASRFGPVTYGFTSEESSSSNPNTGICQDSSKNDITVTELYPR